MRRLNTVIIGIISLIATTAVGYASFTINDDSNKYQIQNRIDINVGEVDYDYGKPLEKVRYQLDSDINEHGFHNNKEKYYSPRFSLSTITSLKVSELPTSNETIKITSVLMSIIQKPNLISHITRYAYKICNDRSCNNLIYEGANGGGSGVGDIIDSYTKSYNANFDLGKMRQNSNNQGINELYIKCDFNFDVSDEGDFGKNVFIPFCQVKYNVLSYSMGWSVVNK